MSICGFGFEGRLILVPIVYFSLVRTAKALKILCINTGSPEQSLVVLKTKLRQSRKGKLFFLFNLR